MATANIDNWRTPPHNIWAFRNIDKVLSNEVVKKGDQESSLESQAFSFNDFKTQLGNGLDLQSFQAATDTDGIIVLHAGKIVYEHYARDNDASSKHILMSMTKSVVGLIAGILAGQGKFDVDAPVKSYVPEASSIWDDVTVRQCLDMDSGIKYADDNHQYRAACGWNPVRGDEPSKTMRGFLSKVEAPTDGPGAGFNYSSLNTDLVGVAIEQATGKKLAELISELLWKPMGAESDALITVDKEGMARAAGGLCATLRDVARIGQLIADSGRGIVPSAWIEDMVQNGDRQKFAKGAWARAFASDYDTVAYRSCWLADKYTDILIALGIFGQQLMVDRTNGIVMAKTSSAQNPIDFGQVKMQVQAFMEFRRILLSEHGQQQH